MTSVSKKVSSGIGVLKKIRPFIPVSNLTSIYHESIVELYFNYLMFTCKLTSSRVFYPGFKIMSGRRVILVPIKHVL